MDTVFSVFDSIASAPLWVKVVVLWLVFTALGVLWLLWETKHAPEMEEGPHGMRPVYRPPPRPSEDGDAEPR